MQRNMIQALVGTIACLLISSPASFADQLFHSDRLLFFRTEAGEAAGHPLLRSGHVVDIHPNGPNNGALERYMINGAKPNHSYDVVLRIFNDDCDGDPSVFDMLQTTTLITNNKGNAHEKHLFPFGTSLEEPAFVGVYWTLIDENEVVAYRTECILVGLDALPPE